MPNMAAIFITIFLVAVSSLTATAEAGGRRGGLPIIKKVGQVRDNSLSTAIYWGQKGKEYEGSLSDTCDQFMSGDIVIISGLVRFGSGLEPALNLTDHCDPQYFECTSLSDDIRACQRQGIKVFLSIGGAYDGENVEYNLESVDEANELSRYLWNNFLGGSSHYRPLGDAVLDGIDFDIRGGAIDDKWDVLATKLSGYNFFFLKLVRLSAGVQCSIPDPFLDSAVKTGVFDYIWVRFFDDESCEYKGNVDDLLNSWKRWDSFPGVKENALFMALPESKEQPGFVPDDVLYDEILPQVENSPRFGGVLMWSLLRYDPDLKVKGSSSSSPMAITTTV